MFECHITTRVGDAQAAEEVAKWLHWKTSEIKRDPVLGDDSHFYLTTHGTTFNDIENRMWTAAKMLQWRGVEYLRLKIEQIVFDSRKE